MRSISFLVVSWILSLNVYAQKTYTRTLKLMGSRFDITVVDSDSTAGNNNINCAIEEILRIEMLISSWDSLSQTYEINKNAGIKPVLVDSELIQLIQRCVKLSQLTDGAFDISYASMDKIWHFDGKMKEFPSKDEISASVSKVGYQTIVVDQKNSIVFLTTKGMKIGFGGIGKGYAADRAKALLMNKGVVAGIINASGDMNTWGRQPNGDDWKVAITNPMDKTKAFALMSVNESAVVTSGDYEKYIILKGQRYSHIIDPRSGYPAKGIISVTVFAPKAELADALATSIFVLGVEVGLNRVNQLPKIECIIIDDMGGVHTSNNINIETL